MRISSGWNYGSQGSRVPTCWKSIPATWTLPTHPTEPSKRAPNTVILRPLFQDLSPGPRDYLPDRTTFAVWSGL